MNLSEITILFMVCTCKVTNVWSTLMELSELIKDIILAITVKPTVLGIIAQMAVQYKLKSRNLKLQKSDRILIDGFVKGGVRRGSC